MVTLRWGGAVGVTLAATAARLLPLDLARTMTAAEFACSSPALRSVALVFGSPYLKCVGHAAPSCKGRADVCRSWAVLSASGMLVRGPHLDRMGTIIWAASRSAVSSPSCSCDAGSECGGVSWQRVLALGGVGAAGEVVGRRRGGRRCLRVEFSTPFGGGAECWGGTSRRAVVTKFASRCASCQVHFGVPGQRRVAARRW